MTPLVLGLLLVGGAVSVLLVLVGLRDQRELWWRRQAHLYANPSAVEPSEEHFARQRAAALVVGVLGVMVCVGAALFVVGGEVARSVRAEDAVVALVDAVEADPIRITCSTAVTPLCEQPRDAVVELARELPGTPLQVGEQRILEAGARFALDLDTGPGPGPSCLVLVVTGPPADRVSPGGAQDVGGRTVDVPGVVLGAEALVDATVTEGPCPG